MRKVLFVDDEVLAMEYLKNLISWEHYGFQVVGQARSGKRALELFDKEKPELVISDIKMAGMDGLELAMRLKQKEPDVVIILLSAYKDFEYAKKGFEYGVSNYLLKHELCEETLARELGKVSQILDDKERTQKLYHNYFVKQLIYNPEEAEELEELGNRFFLILLHKNDRFRAGGFADAKWNHEERQELTGILEKKDEEISYVADVLLTPNNLIVLYRIDKLTSKYQVSSRIEQLSRSIGSSLAKRPDCKFNLIFSDEIHKDEIGATFQKMSGQIRYAAFWKPCCAYALNRLSESRNEEKIAWNERMEELKKCVLEGNGLEELINYLFEMVKYPDYNLRGLRELVYVLENLARELEEKEGLFTETGEERTGSLDAIQEYYQYRFRKLCQEIQERAGSQYSRLVQDILRYMRKNFDKELSLELLGEEFQMNGVYLGQIFKKETGTTFLKFLTKLRIEEAKRLLEDGNYNVSEVAERVGYKTSQYFSQIFVRTTGLTPQEYKRWDKKE